MLAPAIDFAGLYGDNHVYSGFAHPATGRWLPSDAELMRALTGNQMAIVGRTPLVCARGCLEEGGLDLLREAGVALPRQVIPFETLAEYEGLLVELQQDGYRLILQHRHPPEAVTAAACWIDPELLATLNDKACLADFVPARWRPQREVFRPHPEGDWNPGGYPYPFVLKAGTRFSTGGGGDDVCICRSPADLAEARRTLQASERVVAERWIAAERMYCLNYAVDAAGAASYLGGAEMVCQPDGSYAGNWLGDGAEPGAEAVAAGFASVRQAAALGYRGLLGIDVAEAPGHAPVAFDLNFRLCGSTVALLMLPALRRQRGIAMARVRSWRFNGSYRAMLTSAREALREGYLLPLASYRPSDAGLPRLHGMLLGSCRADIVAAGERLGARGWL